MSADKKSLFSNLKYDVPAGLVVYLVALPLCLGVALASTGRSDLLFSGIIAGIIGGIVVGSISGSPLGVAGPAAGLVVIVLNALDTLGSFEAFLLAVVLAGVIQVIAGFLKAGIIGYYFPSSVIKGMLAAIGITLILKEIPHAFGYDADFMGDEAFNQKDGQNTFTELFNAVKYSSTGAIIISVISLGLLMLFDRPFMKRVSLFRFIPGALFVVVSGILLNLLFSKVMPAWTLGGDHLVQLPVASNAQEFFSFFKTPDFSAITRVETYTIAVTLAIVASLETLLCVEATDKLDPYKRNTPTNRELVAQGIGNITSGLIGGLPITQVIVRSSANIDSGGRTKMSTITHGSIMLLSALFIPTLLNYIPLASLAAVLLMVGYKLSKFSLYQGMYKLGKEQFIPFIVTIIAILSTDLLKGIAIGMVVAIYFILRKNYKHSYHYVKEKHRDGDVITLILSEEVTFLNKGSISATLDDLPDSSTVVIDGSRSMNIDYDVLEIIQDFKKHAAPLRNITVETKGIEGVEVVGGH
ncbi:MULTISPECIES: SulP family inorganic anion transporter [Dyadobacter]|uniref:SulP family inorganic anion transporter n=1 Tax=Dyadobacter chenhuakuii TaxID=2909339 RepID=A0ABY4XJS0_9BACT|nr:MULTISPECIES: SulP family inorganic anion transporter [Dyadobacter]MCE7071568.1 SulP family inorganic anion transporter [Dyadobacter sp. CY327]MCF2493541.1 SulP family inorganic anion transporter [Dyadobacter chenhuakuii]MCF2519225.1 SulP family inorganic anion transporter [Dyadobacter sp. CY351]USJ30681.1 SulP family inorganic anion transporter [Dyadobacter chenhuakuii]